MPLRVIHKIVIHWVANPATPALANRNYFENLKAGTRGVYASSHYIVGLDGEILHCIPDTEQAYHAKNANSKSLGIEVCHPDWEGQFGEATYEALTQFLAKLCMRYTLDPDRDIIRHYDVTGKVCPQFYVRNPAHWTKLKADVVHILKLAYLQVTPNPPPSSDLLVPQTIALELNGVLKEVQAFSYEETYYVKLRDLQDKQIHVAYDGERRLPVVKVL
ncbi:MAG: peptidoglycan recognition family protein [Niameybacter sp.]